MKIAVALILIVLVAGCGGTSRRNSSDAAWARAQCDAISDRELREKCVERVEGEYGR
jgi:hypothetical protein